MSDVPYYYSEIISFIAIIISLAGIYLSNEIPYRRARKKVLNILNTYLISVNNLTNRDKKDKNLWEHYTDQYQAIPILPVILLIVYVAIALIWNNSAGVGLYNFLIIHLSIHGSSALSVSLPFIIITIFSVFLGYKLSYTYISLVINNQNSYSKIFLYLLKVDRVPYSVYL